MSSNDMGTGILKTLGQVLGAILTIGLLIISCYCFFRAFSNPDTEKNAVQVRLYTDKGDKYYDINCVLLIDERIAKVLERGDTVLLPHDGTSDFCIIEHVDK
jgi:hypothetical protein